MVGLLGRHGEVVEELLGRLQRLRDGDVDDPRAVVLVAESGAGKSRIVREVYDRLRAGQPSPGYWPALAKIGRSLDAPGADPMPARKVLGPRAESFVWRPNAVPSFGWWAFECERMGSGAAVDVVAAARPQLEAHLPGLSWAWRQQADLKVKLKKAWPTALDEFQSVARSAGLDYLTEFFQVAVPGVGALTSLTRRGYDSWADRHHLKQALQSNVRPAERVQASVAHELAEAIRSLALPGLPHVVVVEDMHLMGADLAELLTRLVRPVKDRPVLVIGTVWPEGQTHPTYRNWVDKAMGAGHAQVRQVPPLGTDDLVTLVRTHAPATDEETARVLAERMPNPHFMSLWLTSAQVQRRIRDDGGAVVLDEEDLARLPKVVQEVLRMRWKEIPEPVRRALIRAVAARQPGKEALAPFIPGVVADAAERAGVGLDDLPARLSWAADPLAWCQATEETQWLRELDLQRIVQEEIDDENLGLSAAEARRLRQAARDVLIEVIDQHRDGIDLPLDNPSMIAAATWLLDMPDAAEVSTTQPYQAALWAMARQAAKRYDYSTSLRLAQQLTVESWEVRNLTATWWGASGRVQEAISQLRHLVEDTSRTLGPDHPDTLAVRHNLASWLFRAGQEQEACIEFRSLLEERTRVLGAEHRDTLKVRANVVFCLGLSGHVEETIDQLRALLKDQLRILGPDHRETLATRHNIAGWLGEAGQVEEAIDQFSVLLMDQARVLGSDHPDTLMARSSLALSLARGGHEQDAIMHFQGVLRNQSRVLGPDHPDTLRTRGNLAYILANTGRVQEAIEQFQDLVGDQARALGADHRDVLLTRNNLAGWLARSGRLEEGIEQFRVLVKDLASLLGSDHPLTLQSRRNLAGHLRESQRWLEAIEEYRSLSIDQSRRLGAHHRQALKSRHDLATCLAASGRRREAASELRRLLRAQSRALGTDHPDTLATRRTLALVEQSG